MRGDNWKLGDYFSSRDGAGGAVERRRKKKKASCFSRRQSLKEKPSLLFAILSSASLRPALSLAPERKPGAEELRFVAADFTIREVEFSMPDYIDL